MKRARAIIGAAVLAAAFSLATAGVAHADPYDCLDGKWGTGWSALCTNGTGQYRAIAYCDKTWPGKDYEKVGNTVRVGYISYAYCNGNDKPKGGTMEVVAG